VKPSLVYTHPALCEEWSPENELGPEWFTYGSNVKVKWLCKKGHEWLAAICNRTKSKPTGCSRCAGRLGTTLRESHPELCKEWSPNNKLGPEWFTHGSTVKVKWLCKKGHEWPAVINSRTRPKNSKGCPTCAGRLGTSLQESHPELCREWSSKNEKPPSEYATGSSTKVWWECVHGHKWEAVIGDRTRPKNPRGCSKCFGRLGTTLQESHPELCKEWSSKNEKPPSEYATGSGFKVWWECEKGHVWDATIYQRTRPNRPTGCSTCAGRLGTTLQESHPDLCKEWSSKNEKSPSEYATGSHEKVLWECEYGHDWKATISRRTNPQNPTGCSRCNMSSYEQIVDKCLRRLGVSYDTEETSLLKGHRFDFYVNNNILIETDGKPHFKATFFTNNDEEVFLNRLQKDMDKNNFCLTNGIHLLRLPYTHHSEFDTHIEQMLKDIETATAPIHRFINAPLYQKTYEKLNNRISSF